MKVWSMTDVGLVRSENQDAYAVLPLETGDYLLVVCDGMGGAKGGAVASRMAVDTFLQAVQEMLCPEMAIEQRQEVLSFCVARANTMIYTQAQEHPEWHGMGTTLVAAWVGDGTAIVCNVGDSRAYRISQEMMHRISKDHSLVEQMIDCGDITAEQARSHPNRNYITRALGPEAQIVCDVYVENLETGDLLFLCTDGLIDTVSDADMCAVLTANEGEVGLNRLLELAKENGAPDNLTAVLLEND